MTNFEWIHSSECLCPFSNEINPDSIVEQLFSTPKRAANTVVNNSTRTNNILKCYIRQVDFQFSPKAREWNFTFERKYCLPGLEISRAKEIDVGSELKGQENGCWQSNSWVGFLIWLLKLQIKWQLLGFFVLFFLQG